VFFLFVLPFPYLLIFAKEVVVVGVHIIKPKGSTSFVVDREKESARERKKERQRENVCVCVCVCVCVRVCGWVCVFVCKQNIGEAVRRQFRSWLHVFCVVGFWAVWVGI
jgi:hypothetical protein